MAMIVKHNLQAMNSNRMLGITAGSQAKSTEKLSSGYKINRAADDAAGLSISEKMRKQIRGLTQASLNAQDGISAVQTAEGALNEVQDMLQRMNELAVKAANGTVSEDDRGYIQDEIDQLVTEIDRVSETTKFNETYLLKGSKQEKDMPDVSAVINGTVQDGVAVEATGNLFEATISDTSTLATGTKDIATVEYLDADGNTRKKEITFEVGADAEATAANLAEAINKDDELSKVFTASSDENGKLSVESKLDGTKTNDEKNAVQNITFESSGGALKTAFTAAGVTTAATSGSYEVTLGDSADTAAAALAKLTDGSSITIDGITYTFDANKASSAETHSFKSLDDLQALLGDDYEVALKVTATATKASSPDEELEQILTTGTAAINGMGTSFTDIAADKPSSGYVLKAGSVEASLVITKKAEVEKEVNALNFSLQVGADTSEENKISIDIESMSAKSLGINGLKVDGKDSKNADSAVNVISEAIQKVSTQRSALGAVQNRLEHTIANLDNVVENTTAAEAQIRDTDMATEMVKYSNNNILAQAGQAMLAQANQANQGVLSLLG